MARMFESIENHPNASSGPAKARPFIKCPGGKTKLLPEILKRIPRGFGTYFEPFVGGGALFFELSNQGRIENGETQVAFLNDANQELAATYRAVQATPERVIDRLQQGHNTQDYYDWVRSVDIRQDDLFTQSAVAAWFIYLNKTGFNGLHRVNKRGRFNVPFGHYKNPTICDAENLRACSKALRSAFIDERDFEKSTEGAEEGDFVYFDPPYPPASKTANFASYTREGFRWQDQGRLARCAARLKRRGVHVVVSNADLPDVRRLYQQERIFRIERVEARRSINSDGRKRGPVGELVIT